MNLKILKIFHYQKNKNFKDIIRRERGLENEFKETDFNKKYNAVVQNYGNSRQIDLNKFNQNEVDAYKRDVLGIEEEVK